MENLIHSLYFADTSKQTLTHYHDCHQILFVTSGTSCLRLNGREQPIHAGNILIISRFEEHSIFHASDDYKRYVLRIRPHAKYTDNPKLYSLLFNRPEHFHNILQAGADFADIRHLFDRLLREYTSENAMKNEMQELLLNELLVFIYRHAAFTDTTVDTAIFEIVSGVQELLAAEFRESFSLKELSARFCVSQSFLSHNFKKVTGVSVMEFLLSCRLAEAKKMLVKTDEPVGKIVEQCGFSDFSNFCRIFKKSTGLTPSGYAARYKSK